MRFAREGYIFIAIAAFASGAFGARAVTRGSGGWWAATVVAVVLTAWVAYFFRDPERIGERGPGVVIAPADGRVVAIETVDEPAFIGGPAVRVSIFMNIFNVHVNRYPVSGTIGYRHYNPGKFLNAADDKASLVNEQTTLGIDSDGRRIVVRQIAGLIARRIVTYAAEGDAVIQGERLGLIRFGSRVDVFVPTDAMIAVHVGERTAAGTTVVARLNGR